MFDCSSMRSCVIQLRAISQEMLKISTLHANLKITNSRSQLHLPGANELTYFHSHTNYINWRMAQHPNSPWQEMTPSSITARCSLSVVWRPQPGISTKKKPSGVSVICILDRLVIRCACQDLACHDFLMFWLLTFWINSFYTYYRLCKTYRSLNIYR